MSVANSFAGLPRPSMPTVGDENRSIHQRTRFNVLIDDFDEDLRAWLEQTIADPEWLQVWGIPDTSQNELAGNVRQLTTPGLYGKMPFVSNLDPESADLIRPTDGFLARAGYWTKMQFVQYLAVGMGDYWMRIDVEAGELVLRLVNPGNMYIVVKENRRDVPVEIWDLNIRTMTMPDGTPHSLYAWDQYVIGDDPAYRVVEAKRDGQPGEDLSRFFLKDSEGSPGPFAGNLYPYLDENSNPMLPWVHYSPVDTGQVHNHHWKRALMRGTMRSATHWTYTARAALFATGEHALVAGASPEAFGDVRRGDRNQDGSAPAIRSKIIHPGTMTFIPTEDGKMLQVERLGPGTNLESLSRFAQLYSMKMQANEGGNSADVQRQAANPTSAAALSVTNEGRREFSSAVRPMFRRSDNEAYRIAALLLRSVGRNFPTTGYTTIYHEVPRSPQEQADIRNQLEWEKSQDLLSPISMFQRIHPGADEEGATAAIVKSRVDRARLDQLVATKLTELGLDSAASDDTKAFNDLTLAAERFARMGDLTAVNMFRRAVAQALGIQYPGDLDELKPPTISTESTAKIEEDQ